jgi:hypothetical protein
MAEDLGNQLSSLQEMKALLSDLPGMFDRLGGAAGKQASSMQQLNDSMGDVASQKDGITDLNDALAEMAGKSDEAADKQSKLGKQVTVAAMAMAGLKGFAGGLSQGFSVLTNGIGGLASGMFNLAEGAVGAVMGAWEGLIGMAYKVRAGSQALRQSFEDVRGVFGDIASNEGKAVIDTFGDLKGSFQEVSGLGISQVFGHGPDGLAKAMAAVSEIAADMGNKLNMLSSQLADNAAALMIMNKGLGLTGSAMANLTLMAQAGGDDMQTALEETAQMTMYLSKQYGISGKAIGKNLNELTKDMSTFGGMSRAELTATAAYAEKLGVSIGTIGAQFDKFGDFEGAAMGAAKLGEAFGMNVDAMELMDKAGTAEGIDLLRESFAETGKSLEDMSTAERKYFEDLSGLKGDELFAAFDPANADLSFDEMKADAEAATEAMSPEDAMAAAAKSISKSVENMTKESTGFLDSFFGGFAAGLGETQAFKDIMASITTAMEAVFQIGRELAKAIFGKDGIFGKEAGAAADGFQDLMDGIVQVFRDFSRLFKEFLNGGDASTFVDGMTASIGKLFEGGGAIGGLGDMLKNGLMKAFELIGELVPALIEKLADMLISAADGISGAGGPPSALGGAFMDMMDKIWGPLTEKLLPALGQFFSSLWDKVSPIVMPIVYDALYYIMMWSLAKAAAQAILVGGLGLIGGAIKSLFTKAKGDVAKQQGGMDDAVKEAGEVINETADLDSGKIMKAAKNFIIMAGTFMVGLLLFAAGLAGAAYILHKTKWSDLGKALVAMIASVVAVKALSEMAEKLKPATMLQAGLGMLAGAALLAISGVAFALGLQAIDFVMGKMTLTKVVTNLLAIGVAILATFGLLAAGAPLFAAASSGAIVVAGLGLLAGALFFTIAGVAYAAGLQAVTMAMEGVSPKKVIVALANLALAAIGTIGLALASIPLLYMAPVLGLGLLVLPLAAKFLSIGGVKFAEALNAVTGAMSGVKIGAVLPALGMMAIAVVATILLSLATIPLLLLAAGMGPMSDALTAGAEFLGNGGKLFAESLKEVISAFGGVAWQAVIDGLGMLGLTVVATIALMAAAAGFKVAMAIVGDVDSAMVAAADFFANGGKAFAGSLKTVVDSFGGIDANRVVDIFKMLGLMITALVAMVAVGAVFKTLDFFGGLSMLEDGLIAAAEFGANGINALVSVVEAINKVPMMTGTMEKMEVMGTVIEAITTLAGLVGMDFSGAESVTGDPAASGMIDSMAGFMSAMMTPMSDIIDSLVAAAVKLADPTVREGALAVGSLLAVVADLAASLMEPLQSAQENAGMFDSGGAEAMKGLAEGAGIMMAGLTDSLPLLITGLIAATALITDPEGMKAKGEALGAAMNAVMTIIEAVGKLQEMGMSGGGMLTDASFSAKVLEEKFAEVGSLLRSTGLMSMLGGVKDLMGSISGMEIGGELATLETLAAEIETGLSLIEKITTASAAIAEGINSVSAGLVEASGAPIEAVANVQNVAAGLAADGNVVVQHEGLNINVSFKVNIDAKDLAAALGDGAEDGPFFVINTERSGGAGGAESAGE